MMRLLPVAAFLALAFLCGIALVRGAAEEAAGPQPPRMLGKEAPLVYAMPRDAYARGPVVVNFFASWCLPCAAEAPAVALLAKEGGVPVYGINYKDTRRAADKFLARYGNPYAKVIPDVLGDAATAFGVTGMPETYVVIDGTVRYALSAPLTEREVREKILPLLEKHKAGEKR